MVPLKLFPMTQNCQEIHIDMKLNSNIEENNYYGFLCMGYR